MYIWDMDDLIDYVDIYAENERKTTKGASSKSFTNRNLDEC